ncbi:MAG: biopolymer transporter ExbD [Candidatus Omnitrophica bacterium]|nr:biopolymer transporter ExbD [Candidatus Omnitrophota bacterium]
MRLSAGAARRRARIEIIPLIDVVFFLLATFVMVSLSMVKNQGIQVRLPRASTGTPQDRSEPVTITVTDTDELYLNSQPIGLQDLAPELERRRIHSPALSVFIHGDEEAAFGRAIRVLDEVRKVGITQVAIQTQGKSPKGDR